MVVYTFEQSFAKRTCSRLSYKVNHIFRWSSFWSGRVCKQAKLSHLWHRKPAGIPWKAVAPKMSYCLVRILGNLSSKISERGRYSQWRSLSDHVKRIVVHKNWRGRILATFGFNRMALRATLPKLHSMFCALFLKITLSAAKLMSFGLLFVGCRQR